MKLNSFVATSALIALMFTCRTHAGVMPPDSTVGGLTIGEWSAEWWKWVDTISTNQTPLLDLDGSRAHNGQPDGEVFFLAGIWATIREPLVRTFAVSSGKYLLLPLINVSGDNIDTVPPYSVDGLRDAIAGMLESPQELHLTIDGVPVPNLLEHREKSPVFSVNLANANNPLTVIVGHPVTGLIDPVVSDGYWVMVEPLAPGPHVIKFGGTFAAQFNWSVAITARVIVVPQPAPFLYGPYAATNGQRRITISSQLGDTLILQASTDLINWAPIGTNVVTIRPFDFMMPMQPDSRSGFTACSECREPVKGSQTSL